MVDLNPKRRETSEELDKDAQIQDNNRTFERFQAVALIKEGQSPKSIEVAQNVKRTYTPVVNGIDRYNDED